MTSIFFTEKGEMQISNNIFDPSPCTVTLVLRDNCHLFLHLGGNQGLLCVLRSSHIFSLKTLQCFFSNQRQALSHLSQKTT